MAVTPYLFCTLASPVVLAEEESEKVQALSIFPSEISLEFSNNLTDEPIGPLQKQEVDINVKFKLDISPIAKWFFFKRRIGRAIMFGISYIIKMKSLPNSNLSVKISESPDWCSVTIDTNSFVFNLNDLYKSKDSSVEKPVKLEYTVNEDAAALEKGEIKIQADFLGFGGIKATSNSTSIFVTTAFIPPSKKVLPFIVEGNFHVGSFVITWYEVAVVIIALVVIVLLELFLKKTRIGMSMQAVSQDMMGAKIVGIPINKVFAYAFALSASLVAISAILLAPKVFFSPEGGWDTLCKAFVIVAFGGLGSVRGTLYAAFILAVVESAVAMYLGISWVLGVWFAVLLAVLAIRPRGISGIWA